MHPHCPGNRKRNTNKRGHVSHESRMAIHSEYELQNDYMRFALTHVPHGLVAQLVEQGTENPRVSGSIPLWATINIQKENDYD